MRVGWRVEGGECWGKLEGEAYCGKEAVEKESDDEVEEEETREMEEKH